VRRPQSQRHRHCVCARHRSPRHQPAVDAEIDAERIKRSKSTRIDECEPEGPDTRGRHRFHGRQARAPACQQRQPRPPANKRRGSNCHRGDASSFARALSSQAAGLVNKQRHVGSRKSKLLPAGVRGPTVEPVRRRFSTFAVAQTGLCPCNIFVGTETVWATGSFLQPAKAATGHAALC